MRKGTKLNKYTDEMINWLKENYKGKEINELAKEMSETFGIPINRSKLQNLKTRIKIKDNYVFEPAPNSGRFLKGRIPHNKGLKWDDYMSKESQTGCLKTTFKKGNRADNVLNIGDERMRYSGSKPDDDGYLCVKVCDGKGNKNWVSKQRIVWEQHYGEIPKSHKVIFLDGDRFNFDINNLALVSNGEEFYLNKFKITNGNPELKKTAVLAVKTRFKTLDKERNMKNAKI